MREKSGRQRRAIERTQQAADDDLAPTSQSPVRWLLANEAGWGVPHGLFEMLAALGAGYLTAGLGHWIGSHLRRRRGPDRAAGGSPLRGAR